MMIESRGLSQRKTYEFTLYKPNACDIDNFQSNLTLLKIIMSVCLSVCLSSLMILA